MTRDRESITDILDSITAITGYVSGFSRDDFEDDALRQDAVIRRFEIIGEAAKRLSESLRQQHPAIPWKSMSGMRDRVIHGYDTIDFAIVWDTINNDLPKLDTQLRQIIDKVDESDSH